MAQEAEHILGKDEVTSSNLVSSLRAPLTGRIFLLTFFSLNDNIVM